MSENFFANPFKKQEEQNPKERKFFKPDGTEVTECEKDFGTMVYEKTPDHAFFIRCYDKKGRLLQDAARQGNIELGNKYNEFNQVVYKYDSVYDEHNVLAMKNELEFEYYDNGNKKSEKLKASPSDTITYTFYDETGKVTEKIIERGTVKTWYDEKDKPIKREINRGSGGIITEDLTED